MIAHTVEGLAAEVEWCEHNVCSPHGMVESVRQIRCEGILTGVAPRAVAAVVAEGDGLSERLVEAERAGDGDCDLSDLERVRETGALVIIREDEHLGLPGESAERSCPVEDAVAIALEAGADRVRLLGDLSVTGTARKGGPIGEVQMFELLALIPIEHRRGPELLAGFLVGMSRCTSSGMGSHGGGPGAGPFTEFVRGEVLDRHPESLAGGCDSASVTLVEEQLTCVDPSCS